MDEKIEPYYQSEAKRFVDSMFDSKIFSEKMTRDDLNAYEDLLAFYMQSHAQSAQKVADFKAKWNLKQKH